MKKVLLVFGVLLLVCCSKQHIFKHYWGYIDTDTASVAFIRDGHAWFVVNYQEEDSFYWCDEWKYLKGPIVDYYCPELDVYEEEFPDNQGRRMVVEIDPYHRNDWLND